MASMIVNNANYNTTVKPYFKGKFLKQIYNFQNKEK